MTMRINGDQIKNAHVSGLPVTRAYFDGSRVTTANVNEKQTILIDGTAWPGSGTATTATTGFSVISANSWSHGTGDAPALAQTTRHLVSADNAGGNFSIDASANRFADGETHYWARFWLKAERTSAALPAENTSSIFWDVASSGTKLRTVMYTSQKGLSFNVFEFMTGGAAFKVQNSNIAYDIWHEIILHISRSTSLGLCEVYANGAIISQANNLPTEAEITLDVLKTWWTLIFPSWSGVRWKLAAPMDGFAGNDIHVRPNDALFNSTAWVTKYLAPLNANAGVSDKGVSFAVDSNSTATTQVINYSSSGTNPFKARFVFSGSGTVASVSTVNNVGHLPYNENGWATLSFDMIYVPAGSEATLIIQYATRATALTFSIADSELRCNGSLISTWVHGARMALLVHFSITGQATFTLLDLTSPITQQIAFSGQLPNLAPQPLGKTTYSVALGASGAELGGIMVSRWAILVGHDSLTHAVAAGVTPSYAAFNNVAAVIPFISEGSSVPGNYPFSSSEISRQLAYVIGRSGYTRASFTSNVLQYLNYSRGICVMSIDGGSINDIGAINSSDPSTVVTGMLANVQLMIDTLIAGGNRAWLSTMIPRVQGTTYTEQELQGIDDFNTGVRAIAESANNSDVFFSDVAAAVSDPAVLFTSGDDTHFNPSGNATVAQLMYSEAVQC